MDNLRVGADKKTGPTSDTGKERSSRNATKHGLHSDSYLYPRKPDKYPECDRCSDLDECRADPSGYCHRKAEIFNKYLLAIREGDPNKIALLIAGNFSSAQQLLNHLLKDILDEGTLIKEPILTRDKDGNPAIMKDVANFKSNPSVGKFIELLSKLGITLPEFGITPKGQKERDLLQGNLVESAGEKLTTAEYRALQEKKFEEVFDHIKKGKELRKSDPITARILDDAEKDESHDDGE